MKITQKLLSALLAITILLSFLLAGMFTVRAASYTNDWQHWSQGASDDSNMRNYGCWVVAQARLIRMLSIDTSTSFNPDTYLAWERSSGHINSRFMQVNGVNAPVDYAISKGKALNYLGDKKTQSSIWTNINSGYYTIICVYKPPVNNKSGYDHYMLVDNETSKSKGTIYLFDSYSDSSSVRNTSLNYYLSNGRTLTNAYTYSYEQHTHSYERGYEAAHPHKIYMKCSCGDYDYTGETTTLDNCEVCHPPVPGRPTFNVIATDETKATGFAWSKVLDAHHYDLRVWKKTDNEEILKVYNIVGTDYSYIFPAGDYYADVCSVDENKNYTGAGKIDFTVKEISTDLQPTGTAVFGNKIFAVFENTVNYDYAKAVCEKMGGHLASIHNKDEQDVIYNLISGKNAAFWLGGSDNETEGIWKWEDGTPWDYDNWAKGEPNNDATYLWCENFLEISSYTGLWNDVPYRYNFNYGFIAEFSADEIAVSQSTGKIREEYDSNLKYYVPKSKYILFNKAVPWEVAEAYCESLGGHLATITSSSEESTVLSIIENGTYLLGGTDKYNEGYWKWINDEEFTYSNWKSGEPNDYAQGEDYASISSNGWNDRPNIEPVGFICEIDIADTYPEKPQIGVEVVGNEIYAWWNKCYKADRYNAYLTYYITEEKLISQGLDSKSFYASAVWEVEDQELNVGAFIDNYAYTCFVAQHNVTYRVKVEAINSISEAKTIAFSEPITIKKQYIPGDINNDGAVNNKDLTRFFQYLSDWDVEVNEAALDVNGDGNVNNKDLTRLFQYLSDWDVEIF